VRFLIVDDDENDRNMIAIVLKDLVPEAELDLAGTVNDARRLLVAHKYDVLLLDVRLGLDDGLLFLQELRKSDHEVFRTQKAYVMSSVFTTLDKMAGAVLEVPQVEKGINLNELRDRMGEIVKEVESLSEKEPLK
jgi:DNA-binding response OmpR family regulator